MCSSLPKLRSLLLDYCDAAVAEWELSAHVQELDKEFTAMYQEVIWLRAQKARLEGELSVERCARDAFEHASNIGSDEQNLDIPKLQESSQPSELNEPMATWGAWTVNWCEAMKLKWRDFHVHHFMTTGKTYTEAKTDALHAATAFLERIVIVNAWCEENPDGWRHGIHWSLKDPLLAVDTPEVDRAVADHVRADLVEQHWPVQPSYGPDWSCMDDEVTM